MRMVFVIICLLLISINLFSKPMIYIYPGAESKDDTRFIYEWELLKNALEITKVKYGDYIMKSSDIVMNGNRRDYELTRNSGVVTIILGIGTKEREDKLNPVRIPLDKGLLGYRVFLINKKSQYKFDNMTNLEMLKKFKVGQGLGWGDVEVWEQNGFKVEKGSDYEGLFKMLQMGRFDFFPRGIIEITEEYEHRKISMPEIAIEKSIIVYYPWPRYFFCSKSAEGKILSKRVSDGLNMMIENGDYDKMFKEHFADKIKKLNLNKRKFFKIKNNLLSPETPLNNSKLWYDFNKLINY